MPRRASRGRRFVHRATVLATAAFATGLVPAVGGPGGAAARGDVIRLKDGTTFEGDIKPHPEGWVVTQADGQRRVIARDRVAGLEARPKGSPATVDARLGSLRRAAEAMTDPKQAVERYRSFIQQYPTGPSADQARADLELWQDRVDRGQTKIGDQWLDAAGRQAALDQSYHTAGRAVDLFRQARSAEAAPVVDQALGENPQNAAAWYLKGVLLFKQDKAAEARKAFDQAAALVPDHAATLNDLAVVQWRQNQQVSALVSYEKALLAAPLHRAVLDNLSEALAALPDNLRGGTQVGRIVKLFNEQDQLLQQQMAAQGMFRWGASWVTKPALDKLQAVEREVRGRVDQMEVEYNALTQRVERLNADIRSAETTLRRMESTSFGYDANGGVVRYPLPPSYYEFLRDVGTMKAERQQRQTEQETMRAEARRLVQSVPTPRYTGTQRLIEWEGTPIF
ncbi:MAG: hypothetical protein JWO31_1366, partial [Phycisphaerales bacterium]|nr:hypothetical protein [Phycisphaerales bacterium]